MANEHSPPPEESVPSQTEAASVDDPLKKVAGAMMTAAEAVRAGAGDAKAAASNVLPAAGRALSKTVYAGCYYLSYGIVFPTMLVAGVFPRNNPVYYGLVDGGRAARDAVHRIHERRTAVRAAAREAGDPSDGGRGGRSRAGLALLRPRSGGIR
jgi:hypothetical protein